MKLLPAQLVKQAGGGHEHHDHGNGQEHNGAHDHEAAGGIEWEDDMVDVNRMTTPANMRWKLIDRDTGQENAEIEAISRRGPGEDPPSQRDGRRSPDAPPLPRPWRWAAIDPGPRRRA
jgi:hypothetical protein